MVVGAALALTRPAGAQASTTHVWYRSAEGCPDGPDFLGRLAALGRDARLANAGDPVDFVVTLGTASAGEAGEWMGRIERQTERGTVAIRELRAKNCADIAASLALSLDLALSPEASSESEPAQTAAGARPSSPPTSDPPAVVAAPAQSGAPPSDTVTPASPRAHAAEGRRGLAQRIGLQGTLLTGVAPEPMPGAALFGELGGRGAPGLRVSLRGGYRTVALAATDLRVAVLTGRAEGCPWSWSRQGVSLEPCLALDLGGLRAETTGSEGRADSGFWASAAALLRAALSLGAPWSVEAELGATVPLVRYDFGSEAGTGQLYRTEPVGFTAGLGVAWAFR